MSRLNGLARRFGYEVRPVMRNPACDYSTPLFGWLRQVGKVGTVIDIGANNGEFAEFLAGFFSPGSVHCFEPIPEAAEEIRARKIPNLIVHQVGLSNAPGTATFTVNDFNPASSLLPVSELSTLEFPQTSNTGRKIDVELKRLDDVLDATALEPDVLVKMDVQGFEDKVIRGGANFLRNTKWVMIEMSFRPLYDGQPLFEEVHALLWKLGFRMHGMKNQIGAHTGEPLFGHFLYMRC